MAPASGAASCVAAPPCFSARSFRPTSAPYAPETCTAVSTPSQPVPRFSELFDSFFNRLDTAVPPAASAASLAMRKGQGRGRAFL